MTQSQRQTHSIFSKQFSFLTNFAIPLILCKENALVRKLRIMQTGIWYIPINVCNLSLYQICMLFSDSHYMVSHIIRQHKPSVRYIISKKCTKLPSQKFHCKLKLYIPRIEETCTFLFLIFFKIIVSLKYFHGQNKYKIRVHKKSRLE